MLNIWICMQWKFAGKGVDKSVGQPIIVRLGTTGCLHRGLCRHSVGQPITLNKGWQVVYVVDCTHLHATHRYTRAVCTVSSMYNWLNKPLPILHLPLSAPEDIILMSIHTSPPVAEINALDPFHAEVVARWNHDDVLIMGDFNADCRYVRKRASSKLKLRSSIYHWWIGNDVDTTTTATDCAYDRYWHM